MQQRYRYCWAFALAFSVVSTAHAQDQSEAAFVSVRASAPELEETAATLSEVTRAKLAQLSEVRLSGSSALVFDDLQLAVGCVGQNDHCLGSIAGHLEVAELIYGNLKQTEDTVILTLSRFRLEDASTRVALRSASKGNAGSELVDAIDPMVHELYDLEFKPNEASKQVDPTPAAPPPAPSQLAPKDSDTQTEDGSFPTVAVLIGAIGVAALGAGTVFGLLSKNGEDEYAKAATSTQAEVDAALAELSTAQDQALAANILFGAGAALVGGGLILLLTHDAGDDAQVDRAVRAFPTVSPTFAGFSVSGAFGKGAAQ